MEVLNSTYPISNMVGALSTITDSTSNATTTSDNDDDGLHKFFLTAQLVYLGIICILGAVGNIMVLAASIMRKELQTASNMFIVNLGIVDLATNILTIPFLMVSLSLDEWIFSDGACHMTVYICTICLSQSVQTMAHIAGARYLLITKPRRVYQRFCSWRAVFLNITFIWCLTILLVILPEFGLGKITYNEEIGLCSISNNDLESWIYLTIIVCHAILGTFILIPFFYIITCVKITQSRRRIQQRNAFQRNVSRIEENLTFWKRELGLSKVLIVTLLAYIICWVPYAVIHFISFVRPTPTIAKRVALLLLVTNSCVNPYIYALLNRKFRRAYKEILHGLWYKVRPTSMSHDNSVSVIRTKNNDDGNTTGDVELQNTSASAGVVHDNNVFIVTA